MKMTFKDNSVTQDRSQYMYILALFLLFYFVTLLTFTIVFI